MFDSLGQRSRLLVPPPSSWSEFNIPNCGSASCTKSQGSLPAVGYVLQSGRETVSPRRRLLLRRRRGGGLMVFRPVAASVSAAASSCAAIRARAVRSAAYGAASVLARRAA